MPHDSDTLATPKGRFLAASSLVSIALLVYTAAYSGIGSAQFIFTLPAVVGSVVSSGVVVVTPNASGIAVEAALYFLAISVVLHDWLQLVQMGTRVWPVCIVLLDVVLVTDLPSRSSKGLVAVFGAWLTLAASEVSYRWGLFDVDLPGKPQYVPCASPPCARGAVYSTASLSIELFVFLVNYHLTKGFAVAVRCEQRHLEAAVEATSNMASALSQFDLKTAGSVLDVTRLTPAMGDALRGVLAELGVFRPYLPEALFAQYDTSSVTVDVSSVWDAVPGLRCSDAAIVFTDLQGVCVMCCECEEKLAGLTQVYTKIIRECTAAYGGYEVKAVGDVFMIAFDTARDAVLFSIHAQETLYSAQPTALSHCHSGSDWDMLRSCMRIGIDYGNVTLQPNTSTGRYDYTGDTSIRAAHMESRSICSTIAATQEVLDSAGGVDHLCAYVIDLGEMDVKGSDRVLHGYLLLPSKVASMRSIAEAVMV